MWNKIIKIIFLESYSPFLKNSMFIYAFNVQFIYALMYMLYWYNITYKNGIL